MRPVGCKLNEMKQLLTFIICLIVSGCGSQYENDKYPDGTCDCEKLTGPVGGWKMNNQLYTGKCVTYYENGNKESEADFLDGKIHGHMISYYPNGNIEEDSEWINGEAAGVTLNYLESGKLSTKTTSVNSIDGNHSGYIKYYFESGQLSEEGQVIDDLKEGVWKVYYENGQLMSFENWRNNVMVDSSIGYFMDGTLQMNGYWNNGIPDGKWTFYDSITGKVDGYLIYENGQPTERLKADE